MDNNIYYMNKIRKSTDFIKQNINYNIDIAIVSGSNSLNFESQMKNPVKINYSDIPNFPVSTVKGHDGYMVFGQFRNKNIVLLKGRFHYYEGYDMKSVTYYLRVLSLIGTKTIILTNAAGAVNTSFTPGDIVVIKDHISFFLPECPLRGKNLNEFGERFPDMTDVYNRELRQIVENSAQKNNIMLRNGVYAYLQGPKYETPAEIKLLNLLKVDVVGMSTVPEAIVARHSGMKVLAFSVVTNMAAGITGKPLSHEEVIETSEKCNKIFGDILSEVISEI